jgi:hypothetical protein
MRHRVHEVPSELPNARLYLEDIEAITAILMEEVRHAFDVRVSEGGTAHTHGDDVPKLLVKVLYRTGGDEMDSIDDLLEQGRSVTDLEVDVDGRCAPYIFHDSWWIRIAGAGPPSLSHYASYDDDAVWPVYGKVRAIFDNRGMPLKNFVHDLDLPSGWITFITTLISLTLLDSHRLPLKILGAAVFVLPIILGAAIYVISTIPNRVFLVRSHVKLRDRTETRRKYLVGAAIFVLGALFKTAVDYLGRRFLK